MGLKPIPFSAGQLTHRVTLRAPDGAFDGGSPDEGVVDDIATGIPARIAPVPLQFQQREQFVAGGLNSQTVYTVMIRYRDDVRRDHQLIEECCSQRVFRISAVQPTERGDGLECTCVVV